jgi:hypothetical protein
MPVLKNNAITVDCMADTTHIRSALRWLLVSYDALVTIHMALATWHWLHGIT